MTALAGATLLVNALDHEPIPRRPQPAAGASDHPTPAPEDRVITTDWPARRAFNFMRGADVWGPFTIVGAGREWRVTWALEWSEALDGRAPAADGSIWIEFEQGAVRVREPQP
jgi:hypothetical protein